MLKSTFKHFPLITFFTVVQNTATFLAKANKVFFFSKGVFSLFEANDYTNIVPSFEHDLTILYNYRTKCIVKVNNRC